MQLIWRQEFIKYVNMTLMWHVLHASCPMLHASLDNNKVKFVHSFGAVAFSFLVYLVREYIYTIRNHFPTTETSFEHVNGIREHFPKWIHIFVLAVSVFFSLSSPC